MKDFAIAISVYDKFNDVKILVDLVRRNWVGNFHITVCSSHRSPEPHLRDCDIDELITTENVPYDPKQLDEKEGHLHFMMRVIDSVRKVCDRSSQSDAPYTVHIHADACPLSWPRLSGLAQAMTQKGKDFAVCGEGFGFYSPREPVGAFDDMFFIFNNVFARSKNLWKFDLIDVLPHKLSIHGALAFLLLTRVGIRRIYHYTDHERAIYWDGKAVHQHPLNAAVPMYYDPVYQFLHIHEAAFPHDLGLRLKANYFKNHQVTKGEEINRFLHKWSMDEKVLFEELKEMESDLHRFFKRLGISAKPYGRYFHIMDRIRKEYHRPSLKGTWWFLKEHGSQIKKVLTGRVRNKINRNRYFLPCHDTVWPTRLSDVYRHRLHFDASSIKEFQDLSFGLK